MLLRQILGNDARARMPTAVVGNSGEATLPSPHAVRASEGAALEPSTGVEHGFGLRNSVEDGKWPAEDDSRIEGELTSGVVVVAHKCFVIAEFIVSRG